MVCCIFGGMFFIILSSMAAFVKRRLGLQQNEFIAGSSWSLDIKKD
jgi:hypothetical protein